MVTGRNVTGVRLKRVCKQMVLEDLPGSSVAHTLLRGAFVGAHLEADYVFTRLHLLIAEVSLVLLGFPVNDQWKKSKLSSFS